MQQRITSFYTWLEKSTNTNLNYVFGGGFWLITARLTELLLTLVLIFVFARFLPKETYGMYTYIISVTTLLGIFTLSGLNSPLIRSVARGKDGMLFETAKSFSKRMKQAKSNMGIIFTFSIIAMIISALVIAQPALSLLKTVASYLLFEAGHSLFLKAVVFAAQN